MTAAKPHLKKKIDLFFLCFSGWYRLRIRSPFLAVSIGNPIFSYFLYKTIIGDPCRTGGFRGGEGLEGTNRKKNRRKDLKNRKNWETIGKFFFDNYPEKCPVRIWKRDIPLLIDLLISNNFSYTTFFCATRI